MKQNLPSNKKFGVLFALIFLVMFLHGFIKHEVNITEVLYLVACIFFMIGALLNLRFLTPLNDAWHSLGDLLGKIVSPIILGIIFFGLITPVGLLARLFGRDELKLLRPAEESYWRSPAQTNLDPESFKNQF